MFYRGHFSYCRVCLFVWKWHLLSRQKGHFSTLNNDSGSFFSVQWWQGGGGSLFYEVIILLYTGDSEQTITEKLVKLYIWKNFGCLLDKPRMNFGNKRFIPQLVFLMCLYSAEKLAAMFTPLIIVYRKRRISDSYWE